jgi:hypothetical protein
MCVRRKGKPQSTVPEAAQAPGSLRQLHSALGFPPTWLTVRAGSSGHVRTDPHAALQVNQPIQELPDTGERLGHHGFGSAGTNRCLWSASPTPICQDDLLRWLVNISILSFLSLTHLVQGVTSWLTSQSYPQPARETPYFLETEQDKGQSEQDQVSFWMPQWQPLVFCHWFYLLKELKTLL